MPKVLKAIVAALAVLALVGAGAVAAVALSAPGRKVCITNGTGVMKYLPIGSSSCPRGTWGPVAFGGGAPGPAGPKGDPGDSVFTRTLVPVKLTPGVTEATVTVPNMRPYAVGLPEVYGSWTTELPTGVSASFSPLPVAAGSVSRSFTVKLTKASAPVLLSGQTVTVTVWVIAA